MDAIQAVSVLPPVPAIGSDTYFDEVLAWLWSMPTLCGDVQAWGDGVVRLATAAYGAGLSTTGVVSGDLVVGLGVAAVPLSVSEGLFAPGQRVCLWCEAGPGAMWADVLAVEAGEIGIILTVDVFAVQGHGGGTWTVFPVPHTGAVSGPLAMLFPVTASRAAAIVRQATGRFSGVLPVWSLWSPSRTLPGGVTFTRASTGTRRNAAGGLAIVANTLPRWHYDAAGDLLGLLIEGGAQNLVTDPQAPTVKEVWLEPGPFTVSVSGPATCGVDVYDDALPAVHHGRATPGDPVTLTVTQAATYQLVPVRTPDAIQCEAGYVATSPVLPTAANLFTNPESPATQNLTLPAGTYAVSVSGTGGLSFVVSVGEVNQGYMVTEDNPVSFLLADQQTITFTVAGTPSLIRLTAMQGVSGLRMADVATAGLAGLDFTPAQGALFVSGRAAAGMGDAAQTAVCLDDGTVINRIVVARQPDRRMNCTVVAAGVVRADLSLGEVPDGADFRVALSWRANDFRAVLNAATEAVDTSGAAPASLTTLRIGRDLAGHELCGTINHLALFAAPVGEADMWAVTVEA